MSTLDEKVADAAAQLTLEQTEVNAALVRRIFKCQRAEAALRVSEGRLQSLLAHQRSDHENERRRMAMEIHDSLGQNLLALRLDVAALQQQTSERQTRLHGWVSAALDNLDGTISSVRHLIADLRPFQLELGLQAVLEWEINQFQRAHAITCSVAGMHALRDVRIDDVQLLTVYRTLQECLDNIVRHAQATEVTISVRVARRKLTLRVADNGVGLRATGPPAPGFGLMGMRERVRNAGGMVALTRAASVEPFGTAVTVTIPLCAQK